MVVFYLSKSFSRNIHAFISQVFIKPGTTLVSRNKIVNKRGKNPSPYKTYILRGFGGCYLFN